MAMLVLCAPTLTLRLATRDFPRGSFIRLGIHGCSLPNRLLPDGQVSKVQAILEQYTERHDSVIILLTAVAAMRGAPLATHATVTAASAARAGAKTI
jgi:hypothetical protein